MRSGLAICVVLLALVAAGPAAGQEIRPTLDKIKETGAIQLGYRETSRPFSFRGSDGQPAGFSVDLCTQVAGALRESLKLPGLKVAWVPVTPATALPSSSRARSTSSAGRPRSPSGAWSRSRSAT